MYLNTLDGLAHPHILETAKNLAWKQVGLGFCRPQDHQDLMQDLLLYLCKQVSRYTGELDLVTWACRLLHGRINRINRRLLGIPSPSQQRRTRHATATKKTSAPAPAATPAPEPPEGPCLTQPAPSQQETLPTLPTTAKTQPVAAIPADKPHPQPTPNEKPNRAIPRDNQANAQQQRPITPNPKPETPATKPDNKPPLFVLGVEVGSWWQRLLLFRAAMVSRWKRPP